MLWIGVGMSNSLCMFHSFNHAATYLTNSIGNSGGQNDSPRKLYVWP
jgi:hypothetical protein